MTKRPFDVFVLPGAAGRSFGTGFRVLVDKGVAAVADAEHGSAPVGQAIDCASLSVDTVIATCIDDPTIISAARKAFRRAGASPLVAAVRMANRHLRELIRARRHGMKVSTTSLAAMLMVDAGVNVAWVGQRARVHRVRGGAYELLTPTSIETVTWTAAKELPEGSVALGPTAGIPSAHTVELQGMRHGVYAKRDLGVFGDVEVVVHEATYPVKAGDWIVATPGWPLWADDHERDGDAFLGFLAEHTSEVDTILVECIRRAEWQRYLPLAVIRCNRDLG